MAERTFCPACGAPLEIEEGQDTVECSFCNARFHVEAGEERPRLNVESQPGPQKDVLAQQANRVLEDSISEEARRAEASAGEPADDDGISPGYTSLETGHADPTALGLPEQTRLSGAQIYEGLDDAESGATLPGTHFDIPEEGPSPAGNFPVDFSSGSSPAGTPAVGNYSTNIPGGRNRRNQWIAIGVAVFVVTCIMCACVVGAIMLFQVQALPGGGF